GQDRGERLLRAQPFDRAVQTQRGRAAREPIIGESDGPPRLARDPLQESGERSPFQLELRSDALDPVPGCALQGRFALGQLTPFDPQLPARASLVRISRTFESNAALAHPDPE